MIPSDQVIPLILTLAGTVIVSLEAFLPGAYLMVLGAALLGTGVTGIFINLSTFHLGIFVLIYGILALLGYRELSSLSGKSEKTISSDSLVGEVGIVTEKIGRNSGEVRLNVGFDPNYSARALNDREIPEGTEVVVVDPGGGNVVTVEPVKNLNTVNSADEIKGERKKQVINELRSKKEQANRKS